MLGPLDNAFKTAYSADVFHEPEIKYADNGSALGATASTSTAHVPISPTTPTKLYAKDDVTGFSPGSSPEPESKPEIPDRNSPELKDQEATEILGKGDLARFHRPKNRDIRREGLGKYSGSKNAPQDPIPPRTSRSDDGSYPMKRPRSVLVMPQNLKCQPIGHKNHFFNPKDRNGDISVEKMRKTEELRSPTKNVIKVSKINRLKESSLKKSLDEPCPHNEIIWSKELEESALNPPKIRLPKAIRNENTMPETMYQNIVVHHQPGEVYQTGETTHLPQTVAYVQVFTTNNLKLFDPLIQPKQIV